MISPEDIKLCSGQHFVEADATPAHSEHAVAAAVDETVDGDHGRVERRKVTAIEDVGWLTRQNRWAGVKAIVRVEREREREPSNPPAQKKKQGAMPENSEPRSHVSAETSYYITSLSADAAELGTKIRNHWHIENKLHWVLDMAFREDECRIRHEFGAQNVASLRKVTLNLLRLEKSTKAGLQRKRKMAGWNNDYLLKVLAAVAEHHRDA